MPTRLTARTSCQISAIWRSSSSRGSTGSDGRDHAVGLGQRVAIDLAARAQRKTVHRHERRRDHILGQSAGEELTELLWLAGTHDVGREPHGAVGGAAGDDDGVPNLRMPGQRGLDLAGLDAEAANLDLVVEPADELKGPVGPPAHEVARPIKTLLEGRRQAMHDEALGRELRAAAVAARQPVAGDPQLAVHADRHRAPPPIEHVDSRVGDGPADRHRVPEGRRARDRVTAREGRALGRAVAVDETERRQRRSHEPDVVRREHIAPGEKLAERSQTGDAVLDHPLEEPGRKPEGRHVPSLEEPAQLRRGQGPRRRDDEAPAVEQRAPDLERRDVEREWGELEHNFVGSEARVARPLDQPDDVPVSRLDPLGLARGARRVRHVREIGRAHRSRKPRVRPRPGAVRLGIETDRAPLERQPAPHRRLGEEDADLRVAEHEGEAFRRRREVERDIGAARLQNAEQGDDGLDRPIHEDPHRMLRADPGRAKLVREAIRSAIQLAVRQRGALEHERGGVGRGVDLILEQTVHGAVARIRRGGGVPLDEQAVRLGLAQQRQGRDRAVGLGDDALEQGQVVAGQTRHRRRLEEVALVLKARAQRPVRSPRERTRVRSNGDATVTNAKSVPGAAFCKTKLTWNTGFCPRIRAGRSSSTSFSNGMSGWA